MQQRRLPFPPFPGAGAGRQNAGSPRAAFAFPSIQGEASDSWKPFTRQFGMSLRKLYHASCRHGFWGLGEDSPRLEAAGRAPRRRALPLPGRGLPAPLRRGARRGRRRGGDSGGLRGRGGGASARPASARPPPPPVPTPPPRVPGRAAVPLAPGAGGWSGGGAGRGASRWRWLTGCARAR